MLLGVDKHPVPIAHNEAITGGVTCDSLNMKNYHHASFLFIFDTLAGGDSTLALSSGITDGAITSTLYYDYAWATAAEPAANCDLLTAYANANTLTITNGTYSDYMLMVEIDSAAMDMTNQEEWLTAVFTDPGAATGNVTGFAILYPRFGSAQSPTALA